ncbi:repetitive organellar protein-like [Capsicum annuum]|uniref:repetitive organellar protein-like n=1 Tax=Capsicum annuum TaxID=4072 RepID=UPI001FB17F3A|nr:repetitive organellar protein-like [Capsicum annuum]
MSASSNSPIKDKENPHIESQILEPLNPQNQKNPRNQETQQLFLDENKQENTVDVSTCGSLTVDLQLGDSEVSIPECRTMSPSNTLKRPKRKKGKCNTKKLQAIERKVQTIRGNLKPVPFFPSKILDFDRHEKLLRRLGLWDFVHIEFDRDLRVDLLAQLIATYDSRMRCSYVNFFRINVNRADLARALKLPVKKDRGSVDGMDLDVDPLTEESISFLENFVSIWVLLHEDMWIMPNEVISWTKAIKDGHPEKVDWAGLFWFMVEKELIQGDELVDCYYAAHLQYLIKSQREQVLFSEEPEKVAFEVDVKEEDECGNEENARAGMSTEARELDGALGGELNVELTLGHDCGPKKEVKDVEMMDGEEHKEEKEVEEEEHKEEKEVEEEVHKEEKEVEEEEHKEEKEVEEEVHMEEKEVEGEEHKEEKEVEEEEHKEEKGVEEEEHKEEKGVVEEEHKEEKGVEEEECKEEKEVEKHWLFDERADANEPFLKRCKMQEAVSLDNDEEKKEYHELADDNDSENENENENENVNENDNDDDDDEEEEDGAERHEVEDGFDVMPSDDTLVGDGLTGNLLQTMESTQIAFASQGQVHDQSSVELLASRDVMHTGGPFFGSGSKREMDIEPDVVHHSLNGSSKRMRIEGGWDEKPLDFGSCMDQMQQLMMKARMMYEAKEQNEEHININQQIILNELHKRDNVIEHLHKSKCDEIQKRDGDICRLERELFMMGNILDGYRKALKDTQKQFSEYRKKFPLPEEPYYKDAGPGGLMLSAAEMEKLRLKQEEETRSNCLFLEQKAKEAEEEYADQFENFMDKVQMLDKRLMGLEDVVKNLRNMSPKSEVPESEDKVPESEDIISETPDCPPDE